MFGQEVEGDLKVTGEIEAQGNAITNVSNSTQDNNAVNFSTVKENILKPHFNNNEQNKEKIK